MTRKRNLKIKKFGSALFLLVVSTVITPGCCWRRASNGYEPPYPHNLVGWKYREEDGVGILGEFVLKKGESTNNGEVEIKVVELIPAEPCADLGTALAHKRVKLQFIRMADKKVVCEDTIPDTFGGNSCGSALDEFWINGIGMRGINMKEQWVHFMLTGAQKE